MENLKKLFENKLLRTLLIAIVIIILIIIIAVIIVGNKNKGINNNLLKNAAIKYYNKHTGLLPKENYDSSKVNLSTLISTGYISENKEGANCSSYVVVTKINGEYIYTPFINCDRDSKTLVSKLMQNIETTNDGLYNYNGSYIFRGENPNNYVMFAGVKWRIIGIDSSNNIKMVYSDKPFEYISWDDRYNNNKDNQVGINDYEISRLKEYLDNLYSKGIAEFNAERLSRLTKFSVCIGKVDMSQTNIDTCTKILDNQNASIITVNDYMNASLDPLCSTTNTKNCQNYNFLNQNNWTITADVNDTSKVYYIDTYEGVKKTDAYMRKSIKPIIALRNDVLYHSGNGSLSDPYNIK